MNIIDGGVMQNGLTKNQLSLMDDSCRPRENSTHFFWSTKMADCGTMSHRVNGKIVHENAVSACVPGWSAGSSCCSFSYGSRNTIKQHHSCVSICILSRVRLCRPSVCMPSKCLTALAESLEPGRQPYCVVNY